MERRITLSAFGKLGEDDERMDIAYWRSLTSEERFRAAWELAVDAHRQKGESGEFRLDRSVSAFRKTPG